MSAFNPDTFFQDQVNQHCDLPNIGRNDAFALYYAASDLVSALVTFRRLVPELGARELQRLVRAMGQPWQVGDMAAAVVRMIGQAPHLHTQPLATGKAEYAANRE